MCGWGEGAGKARGMGNKFARARPPPGRAVADDFWSPTLCFLSQPRFVHPSFNAHVDAGRDPLPVQQAA